MENTVTYRCDSCGASYTEEAFLRGQRTCGIPLEGGALCKGRLVREGTEPDRADAMALAVGVDMARGSDHTLLVPWPIEPRQRWTREQLAAWMGVVTRVVMRRGDTYPNGEATAILEFKSDEDRAEFANWLIAAGGKLTG